MRIASTLITVKLLCRTTCAHKGGRLLGEVLGDFLREVTRDYVVLVLVKRGRLQIQQGLGRRGMIVGVS